MEWLRRLLRPAPVIDISDGMSDMQVLCDLLVRFEGLRLEPYLCSGKKWTYGYGSTTTLGGRPVTAKSKPITEAQAELLLSRGAAKFYKRMGLALRDDASAGARIAFASLAYNVGVSKVLNSKAFRAYNSGLLKKAEKEFKEFRLAQGKVMKGLVRRRKAEWDLVKQCEG